MLKHELEQIGGRLFKWRGQLPILLFLFALGVMFASKHLAAYQDYPLWWGWVCLGVCYFGQFIRAYTIGYAARGTSGRNRAKQKAESLNTEGIYSAVRHPLYLGNFFMWWGIALYVPVWWFSILFLLIYWLYYERIMMAEEAFLLNKFGQAYEVWAAKTPPFFPSFKNWTPKPTSFDWKAVFRREYSSFFAVAFSLAFVNLSSNYIFEQQWHLDPFWQGLLVFSGVILLLLRSLKKYTSVLADKSR